VGIFRAAAREGGHALLEAAEGRSARKVGGDKARRADIFGKELVRSIYLGLVALARCRSSAGRPLPIDDGDTRRGKITAIAYQRQKRSQKSARALVTTHLARRRPQRFQ